MSIGCVLSYKLGACNMIAAVPKTQANAKSHRNKRSRTMATYFQSSSTCKKKDKGTQEKEKKNMLQITQLLQFSFDDHNLCGKISNLKPNSCGHD